MSYSLLRKSGIQCDRETSGGQRWDVPSLKVPWKNSGSQKKGCVCAFWEEIISENRNLKKDKWLISSKELGPWESQSHSPWLTPKMLRNWWISTMEVPWMSNELKESWYEPHGYPLASPFFCALYLSLVISLLVCTLSSAFHVFAYSCPLWSPHGCFSMPLYWQVPHFILDYIPNW
jgi:hypothetical protein